MNAIRLPPVIRRDDITTRAPSRAYRRFGTLSSPRRYNAIAGVRNRGNDLFFRCNSRIEKYTRLLCRGRHGDTMHAGLGTQPSLDSSGATLVVNSTDAIEVESHKSYPSINRFARYRKAHGMAKRCRSLSPSQLPGSAVAIHSQPCRLVLAIPEKNAPMLQPNAMRAP